MTPYTQHRFADTILRDYEARRGFSKSLAFADRAVRGSAGLPSIRAMGHPSFNDLPVGGRRTASVACVFLDLTDFTGRSFWDEQDQVVDLAHAVLTGFIEVVTTFGGHPLGLRGDGLFAGFGPGNNSDVDVAMALAACAFSLQGVDEEVNPRLTQMGIHPVQARAGVDFGPITFVRTGNDTSSDINPIGFAANFAAKCEKVARSWEVVVGEGAVGRIAADHLLNHHEDSPKRYQRDYEQRPYRFYDYAWRRARPYLEAAAAQLAGRPTSSIRIS